MGRLTHAGSRLIPQPSPMPHTISIVVEKPEPIAGVVQASSGGRREEFAGWLDLLSVLERLLVAGPSAAPEVGR